MTESDGESEREVKGNRGGGTDDEEGVERGVTGKGEERGVDIRTDGERLRDEHLKNWFEMDRSVL